MTHSSSLVASIVLVAFTACRHPPTSAPLSVPSAREDAPAAAARPPDAVTDAGAPEVPRAVPLGVFPGPLPALAAVALSTTPGGSVTFSPAANPTSRRALPEGTRVTFRQELGGVGQGDATSEVEYAGEPGALPNASTLTEERLHRSPDGRWAVFHAIESCGDFCHGQVVLLGASGERLRVCGDEPCVGPSVVVAWRPDHNEVAIGGWGLRVVALPSMQPRTVPEQFTSPAYAPNGALYARHTGTDDAVYEIPTTGAPRRVFGAPGRAPENSAENAAEDPAPVAFDATGTVLCATFVRGRSVRTLRARPDGHSLAGTGRCP